MKKLISLFISASFISLNAQIPTGYYNGTENLTGYALKTKLSQIISAGYIQHSYGELDGLHPLTDKDNYYENDQSVLDVYSENPNGTDPYTYIFNQQECGDYDSEGDCYNKEHTVPQSLFDQQLPMRTDLHHILPTDGFVNGMRDNFPFGKVNNPTKTSMNGSKVGNNSSPGFSGTVFEPINEFKGDIARGLLYFVTRYENQLSGFEDGNILNPGNKNQGLTDWELDLLLLWHQTDPPSAREIDRNNAIYYQIQNNRNPYIDHPEWVYEIWGFSSMATQETDFSESLKIYPNPVKGNTISVEGKNLNRFDKAFIYNLVGQNVQTIENPFKNGNTIVLKNLPKGVYILKVGELNAKFIVQ
ncbi:MAG: endonuclease [Flavobacteriaceae bacterium]|nr:endonuclease [Flavobacteriaceae bacterium]